MRIFRKVTSPLLLVFLVVLLSSWGYKGHRKISECAPPCFPPSLAFLQGNFTTVLVDSASAADYRKDVDDTEGPKHYVDIENYPEFQYYGKLYMSWDSMKKYHSSYFWTNNGILPWATVATVDSLKNCFVRQDLAKAALVAADLGHYVGDGHQPLHITTYFDGWTEAQYGVHSRYETSMVGSYLSQIVYPVDSAQLIQDVPGFVFTYIYANHAYVDSILQADLDATALAGGSTSSSVYKQALWNSTKGYTIPLFRHASYSLASLIYTALTEAQHLSTEPHSNEGTLLGQNYPNPVRDYTIIPFTTAGANGYVSIRILDCLGNTIARLTGSDMQRGNHYVSWNPAGVRAGVYTVLLEADGLVLTKKMVVAR